MRNQHPRGQAHQASSSGLSLPKGAPHAPTLQPPDLGGWAIALLVTGGVSEDDGGLGGVVDVGVGEAEDCTRQEGLGPQYTR